MGTIRLSMTIQILKGKAFDVRTRGSFAYGSQSTQLQVWPRLLGKTHLLEFIFRKTYKKQG